MYLDLEHWKSGVRKGSWLPHDTKKMRATFEKSLQEQTCGRDRRGKQGHSDCSFAGVGLPTAAGGIGGGGGCVGAGWSDGVRGLLDTGRHADCGRSGAVETRGEVVILDTGAAVLVEAAIEWGLLVRGEREGGARERGTDLRSIMTDEQLQALSSASQ